MTGSTLVVVVFMLSVVVSPVSVVGVTTFCSDVSALLLLKNQLCTAGTVKKVATQARTATKRLAMPIISLRDKLDLGMFNGIYGARQFSISGLELLL